MILKYDLNFLIKSSVIVIMKAANINEVIDLLDQIIETAKTEESTFGYFAVLYRRVTLEVKNRLNTGYFDDDQRMEQLDVHFANRYLEAYTAYRDRQSVTLSWQRAFDQATKQELIILQHLLLGINAHINLDLGIAAAEISTKENLMELENDFNKINEILSSLVDEVQDNLIKVWPILSWILRKLKGLDNRLMDFSMEIARDGAWAFSKELIKLDEPKKSTAIDNRDHQIAKVAELITKQKGLVRFLFKFLRWGEKGSVSEKINTLNV